MRNQSSSSVGPRSIRGVSLVEMMIAMAIGLVIVAALATIFANTSRARADMERTSRQIENGRFAMDLLGEDLRIAGFYGELNMLGYTAPGAMPDPCSTDPAVWMTALPLGVQGYDLAAGVPTCVPADVVAGTDVLVVRFANTCEAGVGTCEVAVPNVPYVQVSRCSNTTPPENLTTPVRLGMNGTAPFTLRLKDCATRAGLRRYMVRIYFVSSNNGRGDNIPTLKRVELDGAAFTVTPLVEGIEELNIEYGIDSNGDGMPETYTADPTTFAGCATAPCDAMNNWFNVVTARVNLLARDVDPSPGYTDTKSYTLGRTAAGADYVVAPGGNFRRHAYSGAVRLVNVGQRRERP